MKKVIQKGATAGGDIAGNDVNKYNIFLPSKSAVELLLEKLEEQIANDEKTQEVFEELARYQIRRSIDGIDGLEAKLEVAELSLSYLDAIEKKEMFAKLLHKWSMYSSAQQIFAIFLARAEANFTGVIYPQIPEKTEAEINDLILTKIVEPIVQECKSDTFFVNHNTVLGMIYWLAEQCFIRWHK